MKIQTPAKITPLLHILNKRADGFHDVYLHLIPISLFDTITLTPNSGKGPQLSMEGVACGNAEDNLIIRAAHAFSEKSGQACHFDIHLSKEIPVGAGLGGGSGNAGGVLCALNHLSDNPLETTELLGIAAALGSDIPFFINPVPSLGQGRGEKLSPLSDYPVVPLLVIKPPFPISTAQAYHNCKPAPLQSPPPSIKSVKTLAQSLSNQFESSLLPQFPELEQLKVELQKNGALAALVSGSGSAVFGVFPNEDLRNQAFKELEQKSLGDIFCCQTMGGYHYF